MTLEDMEVAIRNLSPKELDELMAWFEEYYAQVWDKQIEEDANSGRLDQLLSDVDKEYDSGLSKPL
jgi:hypothetical protein